jgi:hypothetical protein
VNRGGGDTSFGDKCGIDLEVHGADIDLELHDV